MALFEAVEHVINKADIILLIIDARMPEMARNWELEKLVKKRNKKLLYVFNKIDLVSPRDLGILRRVFKDGFFVSVSEGMGITKLREGIFIAAKQMSVMLPHVGVVGYPNVGKSALINILARGSRTKVSAVAGTTRGVQWVKVGKLRVIDSPGVIPLRESERKLGFIGAKNPEHLKNPEMVAVEVIEHCIKKDVSALEKFYKIDITDKDSYEIMLEIGNKRGFLSKGGKVDEKRTAIQIVRDWNTGKLKV